MLTIMMKLLSRARLENQFIFFTRHAVDAGGDVNFNTMSTAIEMALK